jgi:hypothetical protein
MRLAYQSPRTLVGGCVSWLLGDPKRLRSFCVHLSVIIAVSFDLKEIGSLTDCLILL